MLHRAARCRGRRLKRRGRIAIGRRVILHDPALRTVGRLLSSRDAIARCSRVPRNTSRSGFPGRIAGREVIGHAFGREFASQIRLRLALGREAGELFGLVAFALREFLAASDSGSRVARSRSASAAARAAAPESVALPAAPRRRRLPVP